MIIANNKMATLTPYIDEYELQELIAEKPALITDEENSEELIFLKREVHLKATGKIDVLMMSPCRNHHSSRSKACQKCRKQTRSACSDLRLCFYIIRIFVL